MTTIAIIEFSLAFFYGISIITQFTDTRSLQSVRRLYACFMHITMWLVIDACSYVFSGPIFPFALRYAVNLVAYPFGCVVMILLIRYREAYIRERTQLNPWLYRVPEIVLSAAGLMIVAEFLMGHIIRYENGVAVEVFGMPILPYALEVAVLLYLPFVALAKRKEIGMKAAILFGMFDIIPVMAILISMEMEYDISVIFGATEFLLVASLLTRGRIESYKEHDRDSVVQLEEQKKQLEETLTFTNFFLDTYVSAYYVNLKTFKWKIYKRTDELEEKYPIVASYMDSLTEYVEHDVHPDDREALLKAVSPEVMRKTLEEQKEYTCIFRDLSGGVEKTYRMQVIRGSEPDHAAFGFIDITEEMQAQKAKIRESEEAKKLIESIAATYNVAYAVNMDDDSFKLLRMDENVIGRREHFDRFTEALDFFINLLPERDRDKMRHELEYDTIRTRLKEESSYDVEYRVPINGAIIWHEMNITAIDDKNIAIGFAHRDLEITQRHLEDKRFSEYFALYEIDIDSDTLKIVKDSPWYEVNRTGQSMKYSDAMIQFAASLEGDAQEFFRKQADIEFVKEEFASEDKLTYSYRSRNVGNNNWVDCTSYVTLRHDDGTPAMFTFGFSLIDSLGVFRQELQVKYKDALEAADAANNAKTKFLFNMSHDIRTPINAIRGFTMMARKSEGDWNKVSEFLGKIEIAGDQLLHLVNQVLEMARIESGKTELEEKPVNVKEEFASMVTILSEQARASGLTFEYKISDIEHANVLADEARMGSITLNITGNAMKYTPEGGRILFELREIPARKEGYASYTFTVEDTGIGMSKEYLSELFEPFSREKSTTVSKIQGTGLGLSIVKNTVDLLGGEIKVDSKPDRGTRFDITIDFKICDAADAAEDEETFEVGSFAGKRILLVEDNEMNLEIARFILEEYGFEVETAEDGDVAVATVNAKFDAGEYDHYDCILMDVQMPRMNGYDATRAIREREKAIGDIHIPIIAMTANAFEEDKLDALSAGMDDHSSKPIDLQKLLITLAKYL